MNKMNNNEKNENSVNEVDVDFILRSIGKSVDLVRFLVKTRKERNMTQEAVAKMTGLKQSAIARFEAGTIIPRLDTLVKYAEAVGVDIFEVPQDQPIVWNVVRNKAITTGAVGITYSPTSEFNCYYQTNDVTISCRKEAE